MLLQALYRYYNILAEDETSGIPKRSYSVGNVSYCLNIAEDGSLINVASLKQPDAKGKRRFRHP